MIRVINSENIPKERRYKSDDAYNDVAHDFLMEEGKAVGMRPFMHEGKLYSPSMYSPKRKLMTCKVGEIPEEVDASYCAEITCPYCGNTIADSWEMNDNDDEMECGYCGTIYAYEREVEVTYSSKIVRKGILPEV